MTWESCGQTDKAVFLVKHVLFNSHHDRWIVPEHWDQKLHYLGRLLEMGFRDDQQLGKINRSSAGCADGLKGGFGSILAMLLVEHSGPGRSNVEKAVLGD